MGLGAAGGTQLPGGTLGSVQSGDVPSYADFVPADDRFRLDNDTFQVTNVDIESFIEISQSDGEGNLEFETTPFQLEPLILTSFLFSSEVPRLGALGLGEALPIATVGGQVPQDGDVPDPRTDRLTGVGQIAVASGSYDADVIAAAIEESELTESDTPGVFVGPDPTFGGTQQDQSLAITWSSEYVITGPSVELVAAVEETAQGERDRLAEQNQDFATQLAAAGAGELSSTSFSPDGDIQAGGGGSLVDYSPIAESQVQGYTHSHVIGFETGLWSATTALSYPSTDAVDGDALSGVGSMADERSLSSDGRFVTVESSYAGLLPSDDPDDGGSDDGSGDDGTGDGGTDDGSGDDGTGGSGSDDESGDDDAGDGGSDSGSGDDDAGDSGTDDGSGGDGGSDDGTDDGSGDNGSGDDDGDDNSSGDDGSSGGDGLGPGFGALSAVAGLGGAGYLLSRRLGGDTGPDEENR
ncbi:MAG: hypothetical protein J07HX64_02224 [halophilic archaeon J07HX64]|nr:MAG: hypothetical protein J07HX64_02224 [halophilic archaeon J07HX64]